MHQLSFFVMQSRLRNGLYLEVGPTAKWVGFFLYFRRRELQRAGKCLHKILECGINILG